jgi:hypothetical protein
MEPVDHHLPALPPSAETQRIAQAILDFIGRIPPSREQPRRDPQAEARRLIQRAAQRAALTSGSLALPPGVLGWLTVLPELMAIWRVQAQLVSDLAALYGKHAELDREQMLWCLFRHTAAQAFRDLVVRMGDRLLFRRLSANVLQQLAQRIGVSVSRRVLGAGAARWLPVVGAVGVGAYAWYDTRQVGAAALAMLRGEIVVSGEAIAPTSRAIPARRMSAGTRHAANDRPRG